MWHVWWEGFSLESIFGFKLLKNADVLMRTVFIYTTFNQRVLFKVFEALYYNSFYFSNERKKLLI